MQDLSKLTNQTIPEIEKEISTFWKENRIFEKVQQRNIGKPNYRFVDGPPFPNSIPHYGHMLCSVAKDVIPRYQVMKGKNVRRVFGWDCHGLAIEEKLNDKLGIKGSESKVKIEEEIGVKQYIEKCRELVGENIDAWRWYMDKIGRWSNMDNAYKTMDGDFGESVVWAFKKLWEKGLIYKGKRTSLYSTDSGTPVSEFEVNMDPDNYKETEDVSVYMAFLLDNQSIDRLCRKANIDLVQKIFVLSWTTTPWTLYANFALAINEGENYLLVKFDENKDELVVVAEKRYEELTKTLPKNFVNPQVVAKIVGDDLIGLGYEQLLKDIKSENVNDFKIYHGDFVSMDDGTGVVHIAPAYGADDYSLGVKYELSDMGSIDDSGHMIVGEFTGKYLRDANLEIGKSLLTNGRVWKIKSYKHRLPYYRTSNPLIYKTQEAWFVNIQDLKPRMLDMIDKTKWVPESVLPRWRNTLETSPDWCISRDRYWNTVMPLWVSEDGDMWVIGSFAELMENSKNQFEIGEDKKYYFVGDGNKRLASWHRDVMDEVVLYKDGKEYRRVKFVLDNWMDAGSVPFAEYHYPFENMEVFEQKPSADFIVEYVGQIRAWFNVLFRMSTGVFDEHAFDNVICTGTLAGNDGRKMSKSYGNYPDSAKMLEEVGGEAIRLFLMNSPLLLGGDADCKEELIREQVKIIILPYINSLKYFALYAEDFKFEASLMSDNFSDKWIISRKNNFVAQVDNLLGSYNIPESVKLLQEFLADLSSWYIKTNRDRFVAKDKFAMNTLFEVLRDLSFAMSPLTPFLAEKGYMVLRTFDESMSLESVHMYDFPDYKKSDKLIEEKMEVVREIITKALNIREKSKLPLKQVLRKMSVTGYDLNEDQLAILEKEVNVQSVEVHIGEKDVSLDTEVSDDLIEIGLLREFISSLQFLRKAEKLEVTDTVEIEWNSNGRLKKVIDENKNMIMEKLRAVTLKNNPELPIDKKFVGEEYGVKIKKL